MLLGERQRERLERRSVLRDLDRFGHLGEVERTEQLRPQRLRLGPGPAELLLQPSQRALVPFEQLHLELAEAADDVDAVEHGDVVLDDLGAGGAEPLAARPQPRHGDELASVQVGHEQRGHLVRRPRGRPRLLELDAVSAVRQLQLPQPGAVLQPVTERDPVSCETQVGRVVVGRDEDARRQRLAERREHEAVARCELQLPFDGLAHLLSVVAYRVHNRLRLVNVPRP